MSRAFKFTTLVFSAFVSLAFAGDDFLRLVEEEVGKLGPPQAVDASEAVAESRSESDRGQFESELARHKGTYSFYRKLIEKDKAEVFKAYREGASFSQIRRLIINRSLHR